MIVPIPELTTIFASSTATAQAIFNEYWSYAIIGMGLFIGPLILIWLYNKIMDGFEIIFSKKEKVDF